MHPVFTFFNDPLTHPVIQSRMGASMHWEESFFTLDEERSRAVTEAFVRLYDRGLLYRDTRVVNWCPTLNTAISNIEASVSIIFYLCINVACLSVG